MWNNYQSNFGYPTNSGNYDHWAALAQQWAANRTAINHPQQNIEPIANNYPPVGITSQPPPPPPPPPSNNSNEPDWTADVLPLGDSMSEQSWSQQPLPPGIGNDKNLHSNSDQWNCPINNSAPALNFHTPPPNFQRPPINSNFFPLNHAPPPPSHVLNRPQRPPIPPQLGDNDCFWSPPNAPFPNQPHGDIDERVMPAAVSNYSPWTDKDVDYRPQIPAFAHQIIEAAAKSSLDMMAPPPVPTHLMESLTGGEGSPSDTSVSGSSESGTANKKRAIPAWLRDALDRREKEKLKEAMASVAAEEAKLGVKRDAEGDVVMEDIKDDKDKSESPKKGKFDEDSASEQENVSSDEEPDEPSTIRLTLNELLQDLDEDRKEEELAYSLTRVLTEVLLEVTNQEMHSVASRVIHKEESRNGKVRKLAGRNSKASTPNKHAPVSLGGLLDYGSGSDNDEIPEDDAKSLTSANSAKLAPSSDSESGEELDELIRRKKKLFNKDAAERDRKMFHRASDESSNSDNEDNDSAERVIPPKNVRSDVQKSEDYGIKHPPSPKENAHSHSEKKSGDTNRSRSRSRSHNGHRSSRRSRSLSASRHHHSKRRRRSSHSRSNSSSPKHSKHHHSRRHRSSSSSSDRRRASRSSSRSPRHRHESSRKHGHKKHIQARSRNRSLSSNSEERSRKRRDSHGKDSDYFDEGKTRKKRTRKKSRSSSLQHSLSAGKIKKKDGKRRHKSRSKSSSEKSSRKKSSRKDKKSKKSRH